MCQYIRKGRNIAFINSLGVGRTILAISLAAIVSELSYQVCTTSANDLARKRRKAIERNQLLRQLNMLTQPKGLLIDEVR